MQVAASSAVVLSTKTKKDSVFVSRHVDADYGQTNDRALRDGDRVLSTYTSSGGIRLWIITEADRCGPTVSLLEDID